MQVRTGNGHQHKAISQGAPQCPENIRAYERTYVRYVRTYVRISTGTYVRFAALLGSVRALRAEKKGRTEHVRAHVRILLVVGTSYIQKLN